MWRQWFIGAVVVLATVLGIREARRPHAPPPRPAMSKPSAPTANTHTHKLVSFAIDREGRLLATGSDGGDEAYAPVPAIVLWDIRAARPLHTVAVAGGIGLPDQLRRGLQFSASGKLLGFNYFTNAVGILDVMSGKVAFELHPSVDDGPPSYCLGDDDRSSFFGTSTAFESQDAIGSLARDGTLSPFSSPDTTDTLDAVVLRQHILHGVTEGHALHSIDIRTRKLVRQLPLLPSNAGRDGHYTLAPSPSGRWLAVSSEDPRCGRPAVAGTSLIDLESGDRVVFDPSLTHVSGFAFDAAEKRWAAVRASRNVKQGRTHGVTVFEGGRTLATLPGPLEPLDWLSFADGVPFCFSPDGTQALLLRPAGRIERWRIGADARQESTLPRLDGMNGLLWPAPDVAIALGPRTIAFLRMPAGELIAQYHFPE
jgi:hypothetical protein